MRENAKSINPIDDYLNVQAKNPTHRFPARLWYTLDYWFRVLFTAVVKQVNWEKAKATVDQLLWEKCQATGKANFRYRPPLGSEIGPQTDTLPFQWWVILIIAIVLRWLYKKVKK